MYTVKEIADLLDVSQVTVYNHLKKNEKELIGHVSKKQGVTYIKDEGLKILKISMGIIQVPIVKETISLEQIIDEISLNIVNDTNSKYEKLEDDIKNNNDKLEKELKEIKEQNKILIDLMQQQQEKISLSQKIKGLFKSN